MSTKVIDSEGWIKSFVNSEKICSPNFDNRPHNIKISLVVIHCISLPAGKFGGKEVENLFLNKLNTSIPEFQKLSSLKVSSHFFIRRDGSIIQFVSIDKRAWHAGDSIFFGKTNCNDFSIGVELEGTESTKFEREQYLSLLTIIETLSNKLPFLNAITSHEYIAPKRKTDPGPFFDWNFLKKKFQELSISCEIFSKKN